MLHNFLVEQNSLYAKWHQHPRHTFHHFLILGVVSVSVTLGLLTAIFAVDYTDGSNVASASVSQKKVVASQPLQAVTHKFLGLATAYIKASETERAQSLPALLSLLSERTDALVLAMEQNPEEARRNVLPEDVINSLPVEIADKLEKYVTIEGPLAIYKSDNFDTGVSTLFMRVKDKDGKGEFFLKGDRTDVEARPGDVIRVSGPSLKGNLLLAGGSISTEITEPSSFGISDTYSTGNKKELVIMVSFTDNASQPYTAAQMHAIFFTNPDSVAARYTQNSFGKLTLTGDVVPQYVSIPYSSADVCGSYFDQAIQAAEAGAVAQGFNLNNYQIITVMNPPVGCRGGGAYYPGYRPYAESMNNMYGQTSMQEVIEHELGHNLAENHSATYFCGAQSIASTGCAASEYADTLDPLGTYNGQHNHYNVAHKHGMGWFASGNVQSVSGSGTFTIAPLETSTSVIQALRIPKADTGQQYYVGYRQPIGLDAGLSSNVMRGAGIWLTNETATYPDLTRLLDSVPADGNSVDSAMLQDGATFTDLANGLTITQLSHDANGVTLQVTKAAAPCVPGQTTATLSPSTQTASADGGTLQYTLSISNTDSVNCSPSTYALAGAVPAGWTGVMGVTSLTVNPGSSANTTLRTTAPSGTPNGSHTVSATATGADAQHAVSRQATHVIFLDSSAPTVSITSPTAGTKLTGTFTNINAVATDNVGVTKVEFYVDNTLLGTDTSAPYSYKWNSRKATAGAHTILVKAYDAGGSVGTASVSVTK